MHFVVFCIFTIVGSLLCFIVLYTVLLCVFCAFVLVYWECGVCFKWVELLVVLWLLTGVWVGIRHNFSDFCWFCVLQFGEVLIWMIGVAITCWAWLFRVSTCRVFCEFDYLFCVFADFWYLLLFCCLCGFGGLVWLWFWFVLLFEVFFDCFVLYFTLFWVFAVTWWFWVTLYFRVLWNLLLNWGFAFALVFWVFGILLYLVGCY